MYNTSLKWYLDFKAAENKILPFTDISPKHISAAFEGTNYKLLAEQGSFEKDKSDKTFLIQPYNQKLVLSFDNGSSN
jgi:hypothetical protein